MDLQPSEDILIPRQDIQDKITELAKQVAKEYHGKHLILLAVLNGSLFVATDLMKALWQEGLTDVVFDTLAVSSYEHATEAVHEPRLTKDCKTDIAGRHVLLVEDIIDTGRTLVFVLDLLKKRQPATLKTLTLLSKPSRREVTIEADYTGFVIDNVWVEGYGLDTDGMFRGSPDILKRVS